PIYTHRLRKTSVGRCQRGTGKDLSTVSWRLLVVGFKMHPSVHMKGVRGKMMGVIAQIATTLIAVVLTLLAAYILFLSTSQANIDAEVQSEGARIVELLRKSPTYQVQIPYLEMFLRQHYQQKHPELSGAALLYRIVFD